MFRFTLTISSTDYIVNPVYNSDELAKEYALVDGQEFGRYELNGDLDFILGDYDLLFALDIEDEVTFLMEELVGASYQTYFSGTFTKTDIFFDKDASIATVSIQAADQYTEVLAGLDKEYDLIEIAPDTTPIKFKRQPIIQVYLENTSVVMNYVDGHYWEVPVPKTVNGAFNVLTGDHFFNFLTLIQYIPGDGTVLDPDVSGVYEQQGGGPTPPFRRNDNAYEIRHTPGAIYEIVDLNDSDNVVYRGLTAGLNDPSGNPLAPGVTFEAVEVGNDSQCTIFAFALYARFLTNLDTVGATPTNDIPDDDIFYSGTALTKVLGVDITTIYVSSGHQVAATRFGRIDENAINFADEYFTEFTLPSIKTYPINRSQWTQYSLWISFDLTMRLLQENGAEIITLKQGYKLVDVIKALLAVIDPTITHEETDEYSDFYYGSSNTIRDVVKYPIITPKSNITVGDFDQAASRAPIKLSDVFNLVYVTGNCKWHITSDKKLIIEHREYYALGTTYGTANIGADLTALQEPNHGLGWGYDSNKFSYEKGRIPERLQFEWMDKNTSIPFVGLPIEIRSRYVERGNIETLVATQFTSDIDYALSNSGDLSNEGFMFFEAVLISGEYELPFISIIFDDEDYKIQNGYASFYYIHDTYWTRRLPALKVTINNVEVDADTVERWINQEIIFPFQSSFDPLQLIRTDLGDGKAKRLNENASSKIIEGTISQDTQ